MITPEILAERVYFDNATGGDPTKEKEVFVDPATLMLITQITIKVIDCIIKRRRAKRERTEDASLEQVACQVKHPTLLDKITLRKVIISVIGFRRYRREGRSIFESLLRTGSALSIQDIVDLMYSN